MRRFVRRHARAAAQSSGGSPLGVGLLGGLAGMVFVFAVSVIMLRRRVEPVI